ncbi:MAG: hypothetical protein QM800_06590 [Paludibacter sp.]
MSPNQLSGADNSRPRPVETGRGLVFPTIDHQGGTRALTGQPAAWPHSHAMHQALK